MSGRLSGYGPQKKIFEDLTPGDYTFEIQAPGEKGWFRRFEDDDNKDVWMDFINFKLSVVDPQEFAGKAHFHSVMYAASEEKIALAKKPYDPSTFLYQFLGDIGAAMIESGEAIVLDEYLTDGDLDLDKLIGLRFNASAREVADRKDATKKRVQLTKIWPE